jgi:hypothetical protein
MDYPQYCPTCGGEHNNPKFMPDYGAMGQGFGEVHGSTCTDKFHDRRDND